MSTIAQQMSESAKEAMKLTRKHFVVELNYSEESLQELDEVVDDFRLHMPDGERPETLALLVRTWGAYLGEVIRRQLGGAWVETEAEADESAAMQVGGQTIEPLTQVRLRLERGKQHDLCEFYRALGNSA